MLSPGPAGRGSGRRAQRWLVVVVGLVLAVATAACGTSSGDVADEVASSGTAAPTTERDPSPAVTASTATSPGDDGSQRPSGTPSVSPVPDGDAGDVVLAEQFRVFVLGFTDGVCGHETDGEPALRVDGVRLVIGHEAVLCFFGFDMCESVDLAVEWPGGRNVVAVVFGEEQAVIDPREPARRVDGVTDDCRDVDGAIGRLTAYLPPGTPEGSWKLIASQGDSIATIEVAAARAGSPMLQRGGADVPGAVRFLAAGFPATATPVGLYRLEPDPAGDLPNFVATLDRILAPIEPGADGAAVLEIDTGDLVPGEWCIATPTAITDEGCAARFVVTDR